MKHAENDLPVPTYCVSLLQSKAYRTLSNFMTDLLRQHDISLPQWTVLGLLYDDDDSRPYRVAAVLGVRPPVATAIINELEQKKLLIRKPHPNDNRATVVCLTRKGKALVGKLEVRLRKELQSFMSDVTVPEFIVYVRVLTKLAAKP